MTPSDFLPRHLRERALFLVWGPPSHGPRSAVFARELGIPIEFIYSTRRRGWFVAPFKFGYQTVTSIGLLLRLRPRYLFVQSPPTPVVAFAWLWGLVGRSRFVVDTHSSAMQLPRWSRPEWVYRFLARRALATIVTNKTFADRIRAWGGEALVLRDIPTDFPTGTPIVTSERFNVMVVGRFAFDEPFADIVEAARQVDNVEFYVTGDTAKADPALVRSAPPNIHFTGFMSDPVYYATMRSVDAVMCLTTRDNTMQRGACEALSMARPIITSDWPLLRDYFSQGTVHVDASADSIARGVTLMLEHHPRFESEINALQASQQAEWQAAVTTLVELLERGERDGGDAD